MIDIQVDYHSGVPVYKQVIAAITGAIQVGELADGDKLPSIRELSAQLDINPNTVAKVYRELELTGLIASRAGSGCFVLPQETETLSVEEKHSLLGNLLSDLLHEARKYRISEQEVLAFIKKEARS
jgi:GntR family transcriptional regulator